MVGEREKIIYESGMQMIYDLNKWDECSIIYSHMIQWNGWQTVLQLDAGICGYNVKEVCIIDYPCFEMIIFYIISTGAHLIQENPITLRPYCTINEWLSKLDTSQV